MDALEESVKVMFRVGVLGVVVEQLKMTVRLMPEVLLEKFMQVPEVVEMFQLEMSVPPSLTEAVAFA